jgi:PAS domain S-box-containing protein
MPDGIRVLYVDDEPGLLEVAREFLEENGEFSVDTVESAPAALDILGTGTYDAIIADYHMPEMDGIGFLKKVRAFDKTIPFILFTGRGREEVVIEAINNGADFYLQKGGSPEAQFAELAHKIRQAVQMRRAQVTLAGQEQRFHDLQNSNDLIQSIAPDGHFLFVNQKWLDTLGYQEDELAGLTVFDVIHEESRDHCREIFGRVIAGESVGIIDATFRKRDGGKVYVEGMASCRMVEGQPQYTRGIFKDVTDRKRAEAELLRKNEDLNAAYEQLTATEEELRQNYDELSKKEEVIRASEEKFRALVDHSLEGILILDPTGKLLFANGAAGQLIEDENVPGMIGVKNVMEFIAPESQADVLNDFSRVAQGVDGYLARYKLITTLRHERWVESMGKSILFGGAPAILISLRDITDRQAAEVIIREKEEKFRTIFANSPYPIAINSIPDNRFLEINKAFLDVSGYTEEEILGKDPVSLGLLSLTEMAKLVAHRLLTGKIENVPLALTAKEGRRVHVLFSTIPVTINTRPAILTVTVETTKLKRVEEDLLRTNEDLNAAYEQLTATEEELRQNYDELRNKEEVLQKSEEKFRALVELSLDGIFIVDFLGRLLYANRAAGLIVDAPDYQDLIGKKNVMEFVDKGSMVSVLRDFSQVALGIDAYLVRYKLITQKNREVWVECIGKKIPYMDSTAMLVSMRDITERRRAEEALQQANKKLNLLSGITRHDIKNQLTTMDGFIALLHKKIPDPSYNPHFSRITDASSQILKMIQFTKEYEMIGVNAPVWQDIRTLVDNAGRDIVAGKITLKNDLPENTEIFADPLVARVFSNLADNAVRHGGKITTIRFSVEEQGWDQIIVCEDDGDGISAEIKELVFERGFGKNTGFGLALSREVLDITGITIRETGKAGKGARFEIAVPKIQYRSRP